MNGKLIILLLSLALLSSCFKKEDPIVLPPGNSEIRTLFLGNDYEKELYFDLGSNTFQERQSADWDIRFESAPGGYGVFLNNGNDIIARKIDIYNLSEDKARDTLYFQSYKELVDAPEGKAETSAIGDWRQYRSAAPDHIPGIYIIELSYGSGYERYRRLQMLSYDDTSYTIRISRLYLSDQVTPVLSGDTIVIPKDKNRNFTAYSFKNNGHIVENAEPDKQSWDIVFMRYKHIFYGILPGNDPFPYRVSGVLSNASMTLIARDSANRFSELDAASIPSLNFSQNLNVIGYDWKAHAFGAVGNYTVNTHLSYVIKDGEDRYYKLRFLDFYNEKGEKGYPKFEFVRIR